MTKTEIRKYIVASITEHQNELPEYSATIQNKILASTEYKNSDLLIAYMALPDEVVLSKVISQALADGKKVYLPHVFPKSTKMEFYEYTKETKTVIGEYDIPEPELDNNKVLIPSIINKASNILGLIPGRAFTKNGNRLGRGKGFYDIYFEDLADNKKITLAGVCFPFQIVEELPLEENDVNMDLIFTCN